MDIALKPVSSRSFRDLEFLAFSVVSFVGKSFLLIRLPYREYYVNATYTAGLLALFYCYFRFRYKLKPPIIIVFCLAGAVAVDVLGNYLGLYGHEFIFAQFDEVSHFIGSGMSLPPALWLLRATTRRFGYRMPAGLLGFLAVSITFSFCAYYEILELWDERFYGGKRLWTETDSANDLQWDLFGIVLFALITSAVFKLMDKWNGESDLRFTA
jgi:hypothetical protein